MKPAEDEFICVHDWCDLYTGGGVDKHDPNIALVAFYCKKCLQITVKSYNQARYKMLVPEEED